MFVLAVLVIASGFLVAARIPSEYGLYLAVVAFVLLISLQIFKLVPRLNAVLLLGLAFALGMLLNWFDIQAGHWFPWVILSLGMVLSLIWAYAVGIRLGRVGALFFPLTILYLIGWFVLYLFFDSKSADVVWAIIGIFLFVGVATYITTESRHAQTEELVVPVASDLLIVYFNLFWLSSIVVR